MTFAEAVKTCFARFFVIFKGRSRRSEYWFTTLLYFLVLVATIVVSGVCVFLFEEWEVPFVFSLFLFVLAAELVAIPLFPTSWRRLHDVGKPGWLLIIDFPIAMLLSPFIKYAVMAEDTEASAIIGIVALVFCVLELIYRIYILVLLCLDGNPYTNKYGPDPKGRGLERQMALAEENAVADGWQKAEMEAAFRTGAVPPVEVPEGKAKKDKGYLTLSIILTIIVVLLMGLLFAVFTVGSVHQAEIEEVSESNASLLAENEALQEEIAAMGQNADRYDSLQQHLHTSPSNPSFYPSEYVFVMKPGETESFTLYCLYDEAATVYTEQYGEAANYAFTEDEWEWSTEILLTAESAGSTELYFSNTANTDAFSVLILVMDE